MKRTFAAAIRTATDYMGFRRKRRLSLGTTLTENSCFPTASATLYRSPKNGTLWFPLDIMLSRSGIPSLMREI